MEAAARSSQRQLVTQARALRTESQTLRAVSMTVRAHSHLLWQRSRALRAGFQVSPAAQRAGVQVAFRRCQRGLSAALPRVEAPLAELTHTLWCWAVCGRRGAPRPGSAEDEAHRAWLAELLTAYAAVERQLHGLMRCPPPSIAALQQWLARLSRRLDGASPTSHQKRR